MELGWLWTMGGALTLVAACYVFVFEFVRALNGWYYDLKLRNKHHPLPPGDMGWPLVGNFLAFFKAFTSGVPDSFHSRLISKYGRKGLYKTHLFGHPTIILTTPELCRKVLKDEENFKMSYPKSVNELVLRSAQFLSIEEHKRIRHLTLSSIMGHNVLSVHLQRVEHIVTSSLESMANSKHPIELFKETAKVTINVIFHIMFGPGNDAVFKQLEDLFIVLHRGMFSVSINLPGFAFHRAVKARRKAERIIQLVMDARREMIKGGQQKTKTGLIDILLGIEDENGRKIQDEDIIDIIIGLVFAGQMNSAGGMMWSIIYLLENPHVMKKAKEEQEEIMKARPPSQKHLDIKEIKQMVYLAKVINETLRQALTFILFREARVDTNINGYFIPQGWKAISWIRVVHMDPENYPNPEEFSPSRWDDDSAKVGAFLPFGVGSRFCPGNDLAKLEISIFLHYFLLGYKIERVNPVCPITYLPVVMPKDCCLGMVSKLR